MLKATLASVLIGSLSLAPLSGCESLPGDEGTQGAVIGGLGGAAAGALIGGDENRLIGALIGGALGAGGGYLIGTQINKDEDDRDEAIEAGRKAQTDPATPEEVRNARTADVDNDGFVTLDEVVAMKQAGLSDSEMIERLERTDMVFDLTSAQRQYLRDRGVSNRVIDAMNEINAEERQAVLNRLNS